ncbi:MAG TPA: hypothetical protein PLG17_02185 [Thermodesulfobacteriota bacterium]|nr:hypothetical protein [Deltaproteobacteria bacterium]HNU72158.1 hypothetical protein [Thermodesulfobacteriota bacterium]HQO77302.1 hypothetical protein [Thermodesulfobacteriota bacterium]
MVRYNGLKEIGYDQTPDVQALGKALDSCNRPVLGSDEVRQPSLVLVEALPLLSSHVSLSFKQDEDSGKGITSHLVSTEHCSSSSTGRSPSVTISQGIRVALRTRSIEESNVRLPGFEPAKSNIIRRMAL